MFLNSIRWKIQAWHGFLLICLVSGMMSAFYAYEYQQRFRQVDGELREVLQQVLPRIGPMGRPPGGGGGFRGGGGEGQRPRMGRPPGETEGAPNFQGQPPGPGGQDGGQEFPGRPPRPGRGGPPEMANDLKAKLDSGEAYYASWDPDGNLTEHSSGAPPNVKFPGNSGAAAFVSTFTMRGDYREFVQQTPRGDSVLVGLRVVKTQQAMRQLAWQLAAAGIAVVALGLAGGWWLAGLAIRPIAEISASAEKIAEGNLSQRIDVRETKGELGQLADVLNRTFERLEKSFEQQVRFTADASHELRTPISIILTQIQLALSRERSPEELRQTLQTCERATERMRTLVNHLLELARIDSGEFRLRLEECDLGRIARESLDLIGPLAQQKKVSLREAIEPVRGNVDALKLGQVLINLLSNAVKHNTSDVEVALSVQRNGDRAVITVKDNGVGIPPEAMPHLFDRFFRVDKSRSRVKGSTGLGLAISKAIVEAHGGTIKVNSTLGHGAEFIVELPLPPDQNSRIFRKPEAAVTGPLEQSPAPGRPA